MFKYTVSVALSYADTVNTEVVPVEDIQKNILIENMVTNLPTLRKRLGISQTELSEKIGMSRSTIAAIENHKRPLTWNVFLSLVLIFTKNKETDKLLNVMDIYTDELNTFIKG